MTKKDMIKAIMAAYDDSFLASLPTVAKQLQEEEDAKIKMTQVYLVKWNVQDGENEYTERIYCKMGKIRSEEAMLKFALTNYYGKDFKKVSEFEGEEHFETDRDYRWFTFNEVRQLTQEEVKFLDDHHIIFGLKV